MPEIELPFDAVAMLGSLRELLKVNDLASGMLVIPVGTENFVIVSVAMSAKQMQGITALLNHAIKEYAVPSDATIN